MDVCYNVEEAIQNSTQFVLVIMRLGSGNACYLSLKFPFSFFLFVCFLKHHMISFSHMWPLSDELIGREEASGLGYLRVSALHQELRFLFFQSFFLPNIALISGVITHQPTWEHSDLFPPYLLPALPIFCSLTLI